MNRNGQHIVKGCIGMNELGWNELEWTSPSDNFKDLGGLGYGQSQLLPHPSKMHRNDSKCVQAPASNPKALHRF